MSDEQEKSPSSGLILGDEFESVYANNTHFEPSVWDLKIIFGQLEQHSGAAVVDWHTGVTIPWNQAKIFFYYLAINIFAHELRSGDIKTPPSVLPVVPKPTPEEIEKDPSLEKVYQFALKLNADAFPQ